MHINTNPSTQPALTETLREIKYQSRLDQAAAISDCTVVDERMVAAQALIREISMMEVIDKFSNTQKASLLDVLWPLAHPEINLEQPLFGNGAYSKIAR